jgi:hypothetical protein
MNPWALLVILIGLTLVILGVKGSQHNAVSALLGHPSQSGQQPAGAS